MQPIPILNVYYLLCYAWWRNQDLDATRLGEVGELSAAQDLLGKMLAEGVNRLVRRGIDRGYVERREDLAGIRGKIAVGETVKRALRARGRVACDFEELSFDILPNRILNESLRRLLAPEVKLHRNVRDQVREASRMLGDRSHRAVSRIRLRSAHFNRVQLGGGNRRLYQFLLSACRLLHNSLIVDESTGRARFHDFRRDEAKMSALFEEFATAFYRREHPSYKVNHCSRRIPWADSGGATEADRATIPAMYADQILESESLDRRIIMDTKFYRNALTGRSKLISANLYQLLAYLRNRQAARPNGPRHEGILLYPQTGRASLKVHIRLEGFQIQARTVNLDLPWRRIHEQMLAAIAPHPERTPS